MKCFFVTCLALLAIGYCSAENENLHGWIGYRLSNTIFDPFLFELVKRVEGVIIDENGQGVIKEVVVAPKHKIAFEVGLLHRRIQFKIFTTDFGRDLDVERNRNDNAAVMAELQAYSDDNPVNDVTTYFAKHNEINTWLSSVASTSGSLCTTQDIGSSYQRRIIRLLKCGTGKQIVFLDAAIHAREHLAPATLLYIIKKLVDGYKANNAAARAIFAKYDFHFLPVVNPDGYDFTFTGNQNRLWRKTRQPYGNSFGADPNRNFDSYFGGPSTSRNPNSDIYCGPRPFSEPETLALSSYLSSISSRLKLYISFHTYGQLWLTPPGYTRQYPADHQEMMRVANAGYSALRAVNGNSWAVGQPANIGLYEAAGGSYDWVKQKLGVKYSYTLELSPRQSGGINGFIAYPSQIAPSGNEVYAGILATANSIQ